jgi:hypothetical protein
MKKYLERSLWLGALALACGVLAACNMLDPRVNGRTADEYFSDEKVAALARAACRGDRKEVMRLAEEGVDVNGRGLNAMSPLMWAINCRNLAGVQDLLKAGADPNQKDDIGLNPLLIATTFGLNSIIGVLVNSRADLYYEGPGGNPAIEVAFVRGLDGDWSSYNYIIELGLDLNHIYGQELPNVYGNNVALMAIRMGRYDKAIDLIDRGFSRDLGEIALSIHVLKSDPAEFIGIEPSQNPKDDRAHLIQLLKARGVPYDALIKDFEAGKREFHFEQY